MKYESLNMHKLSEYFFYFFFALFLLGTLGLWYYSGNDNLGKAKSITQSSVALPDSQRTPGKLIDNLDINKTICNPSWRTGTIRPSSNYTNELKKTQLKEYRYVDTATQSYEEDHLCSLTNGGDPTSPLNLWPQPYLPTPGAREKDQLELQVHKLICSKQITPQEACTKIAKDWYSWYKEIFGNKLGSFETITDTDDY